MSIAEYITKPGDRWDLIAYKAYGTVDELTLEDGSKVNAISHIIRNNPGMAIDSVIMEGLLLLVPFVPDSSVKTNSAQYPPWKS